MPTASPPTHDDAALEARVFWLRFKNQIAVALLLALLAVVGFVGYRLYTNKRDVAASALLASAKNAQDYRQLIARYPNTPAGASAYLFLAEAQSKEKKFKDANTTLQDFIDKNPKHQLVSTARMAMAANLESTGKTDEALAIYRQIATGDQKDFNRPLALISEVRLLKMKNRTEEARRVCETILTEYRFPGDQRGAADNRVPSIWVSEAMRQLRSLKRSTPSNPVPTSTTGSPAAVSPPPLLARPQAAPTPSVAKPK
jgi:predicted negative regulator of RcsB-dependent stress response